MDVAYLWLADHLDQAPVVAQASLSTKSSQAEHLHTCCKDPHPCRPLLRQRETPTWTAVFWALCGLIRRGPVLISAQGSVFIAACPPSCFSAAVMWLAAPALLTGPCACFWSSGSTASAAVTSTCSRGVRHCRKPGQLHRALLMTLPSSKHLLLA